MSTRATIHFLYKEDSKPTAIIYRHSDGYPEEPGLGQDLQRFVADIRANVKDKRFGDAAYLAAKWVVWDAHQYRAMLAGVDKRMQRESKEVDHICNFLSIGILRADPGDIEYRYKVVCDGVPTITCEKITEYGKLKGEPCEIPPLKEKANA
jgi:hypothetical protein